MSLCPEECLYSEMSICPLDCSYSEMSVCTYVPRTVTVRGHTDISVYEQLPGDIGDIRTSQCTNSFQGTLGTYRHLTVQTASRGHRGHMDISLYNGRGSAGAAGALRQWESKRVVGGQGQRER